MIDTNNKLVAVNLSYLYTFHCTTSCSQIYIHIDTIRLCLCKCGHKHAHVFQSIRQYLCKFEQE